MVTVANDRADHMRDLPADPGRYGMPVRSLLGISSLRGASVLAGAAGLDREVRRVNVMEVPDILPWVKPHELLLTTGFPLRAASSAGGALNPGAFCRLVTDLDGRGLSAIAIKLGRYLDELPPAVLDVADKIGMPVLRVPDGVAFDDVITDVFTELVDRQTGAMARADDLHRALAAIVLEGGDLPQIADEVARLLDAAVLICTPDGRVRAEGGTPRTRQAMRELPLFHDTGRFLVEQLRPGVQAPPGRVPAAAGRAGTRARRHRRRAGDHQAARGVYRRGQVPRRLPARRAHRRRRRRRGGRRALHVARLERRTADGRRGRRARPRGHPPPGGARTDLAALATGALHRRLAAGRPLPRQGRARRGVQLGSRRAAARRRDR